MQHRIWPAVLIGVISCARAQTAARQTPSRQSSIWESQARLERSPIPLVRRIAPRTKAATGRLRIDSEGIVFQSEKVSYKWPYLEIHTFDLADRDLTLTLYQNRHWREPGERRFHFKLQKPVPAGVASTLAARVGRPVRNGAPIESAPAIAEIPARHPTLLGGSNGTLRFRESGIDYVTDNGRDSHSWRWGDIQTIGNPDPYTFRITAYREIAEFELKRPLPRAVFDELWDYLYAADLNLAPGKGGERQ